MKKWKITSGIISIVLGLLLMLSGYNMVEYGIEFSVAIYVESGVANAAVGILVLIAGIVSIITRKGSIAGNISLIVLFSLSTIYGIAKGHGALLLMAVCVWCVACAITAAISLIKKIY